MTFRRTARPSMYISQVLHHASEPLKDFQYSEEIGHPCKLAVLKPTRPIRILLGQNSEGSKPAFLAIISHPPAAQRHCCFRSSGIRSDVRRQGNASLGDVPGLGTFPAASPQTTPPTRIRTEHISRPYKEKCVPAAPTQAGTARAKAPRSCHTNMSSRSGNRPVLPVDRDRRQSSPTSTSAWHKA